MKSYNLSRVNLLLVESNPFMRRVFLTIFREFGIRNVMEAMTPADAYRVILHNEIDLIFSNWTPELDAMSLLREIRTSDETPDPTVPVVIVSAYTELNHVLAARDRGMTEYLAMPISAASVYQRICTVIEGKRPFIRTGNFAGPDRRRRRLPYHDAERRRDTAMAA